MKIFGKTLSVKLPYGSSFSAAILFMIVGIIFWGGFNTAMESSNDLAFCISCHEMKDNVYDEYKKTVHYQNRSGIQVMCSDCHVPKEWIHKVVRKIQASNELVHKMLGSVDTKEKFNAKRLQLANSVWQAMEQTDSRECRNCHSFKAMDIKAQETQSGLVHKYSKARKKTCIDCHKGIAHKLPEGVEVYRGGSDADHEFYEKLKLPCYKCHSEMQKIDDSW